MKMQITFCYFKNKKNPNNFENCTWSNFLSNLQMQKPSTINKYIKETGLCSNL